MSEERIAPHIHPFNYFITKRLDEIYTAIIERRYTRALRMAINFVNFLEPKIVKKLQKDIEKAKEVWDGKAVFTDEFLQEFIRKIMVELHKEGYFTLSKFQPITAESFKKLEESEQ